MGLGPGFLAAEHLPPPPSHIHAKAFAGTRGGNDILKNVFEFLYILM